MSAPNETTAINSTNSAPYLSADRSELAPLFTNPQETKGLRLIAGCFTIISLLISLALAAQVRYGNHQVAPHGSVVSDSSYCSRIGASIIEKGGNSVDAAIAATFCMGLVHPHLTGLGGGGLMLIYDHRQHRIKDCLDFRVSQSKNRDVGIPGLLAGLYQAHYLHGSASWEELLAPSIRMARSGFGVSSSLVMAKRSLIANVSDLRTWLEPLQQGSIITSTQLADTLSIISTLGPDGTQMVEDQTLTVNRLLVTPRLLLWLFLRCLSHQLV
ncbi:glutathione hydrolase 7-like [Nilaparvata lugens]|uniref:glutathione hydrolase 7-like n=1 Tax=Nilaparvata lugens TaxID=108931 RepID=UPI00193D0A28|nr:glutathione hydrolase 7-like [Nilaparvata lugens]